ncbi:MAG: S1 RNA-binding domain-containing protein [Myxococcota bacterium]
MSHDDEKVEEGTAPAPVSPAPSADEAPTTPAVSVSNAVTEAAPPSLPPAPPPSSPLSEPPSEAASSPAPASTASEPKGRPSEPAATTSSPAAAPAEGAAAAPQTEGSAAAPAEGSAAAPAEGSAAAPAEGAAAAPAEGSAAAPAEGAAAAPAEGAAAAGGPGDGPAGDRPSGEKKKRKRRRRRKKKPGEEGSDGAPAATTSSSSGAPSSRRRPGGGGKPPERPAFNVGDEIFGRVSKVTDAAIWLDVAGGKATGLYAREELIQVVPKEGQQFIAKVKSYSTRGGVLMLGRELWDTTESRTEVRAAVESQTPLPFWVTAVIKGGLEVDYKGVRAFAPASHVDVKPNADLAPLLGQKLDFVVTQYAKKGRDVVVSRKAMVEAEHHAKRKEHLEALSPEMQVKAIVRNVLQWGAFVALPEHGNIEGVIHMSEASHNRSARLADIFKPGAEIDVKVLRIDDKGKLWLSHKATQTDPWEAAPKTYAAGTIHQGKVVRLTDFGAFVQLEPGIDGLCHVADLSFKPIEHPREAVKEGQDFDVIVAHIDPKARKVTLHPAPAEGEREEKRRGRLTPHQVVQVEVVQHREAGLGVRIIGATGRHARGFIHASQTGTPRGSDLRKGFPLGQRFDAKITDSDARRGESRLSIKALKADVEKKAYREYRKQVQRESSFGTFADLLKDKL